MWLAEARPSSYTATTTTTRGPHDPAQMPMLSSLTPYNLGRAAILIPILQMQRLRLTKVKSLSKVTKQSWAWNTVQFT